MKLRDIIAAYKEKEILDREKIIHMIERIHDYQVALEVKQKWFHQLSKAEVPTLRTYLEQAPEGYQNLQALMIKREEMPRIIVIAKVKQERADQIFRETQKYCIN